MNVTLEFDDWLEVVNAFRAKMNELEGAKRSRLNPARKAELHADLLRFQRIEASLSRQIEKQIATSN